MKHVAVQPPKSTQWSEVYSARIVVVDDDDAERAAIVAIAHEAMPAAMIAEHNLAGRALEEVSSGTADLLITNCHMPDMDGPMLVQTIREAHNPIPIIMVSGSENARDLGEKAGIDRFVPKFEIFSTLTEAIHALVDGPIAALGA
jgi:CheY-like chemotaxis protein